jgi:hypothetical protein
MYIIFKKLLKKNLDILLFYLTKLTIYVRAYHKTAHIVYIVRLEMRLKV